MHVHVEAVEVLEPGCQVLVLLADQCGPGVCCIDVDPDLWVVFKHLDDVRKVIDCTGSSCPQCQCKIKRF